MIPERTEYNLKHKSVVALKMGRLQTVSRLPVIPGDTFMGKIGILSRLSPFKKVLLADLQYDAYTFYCPMRDYYEGLGLDSVNVWRRFILDQGRTTNLNAYLNSTDQRRPFLKLTQGTYRRDIPWSYYRFHEGFFEDPDFNAARLFGSNAAPLVKKCKKTGRDSFTESSLDPNLGTSAGEENPVAWYGEKVSKLKTIYTSLRKEPLGDKPTASLEVSSGNVELDMTRLGYEAQKNRRETIQNTYNRRANLQSFYQSVYGTKPRDWNDAFPELVAHQRANARISDVISQGDERLGEKVSHGVAYFELNMPPRFFAEHGWLWTVVVMRTEPFFPDQRYLEDSLVDYWGVTRDPIGFGLGEALLTRGRIDGSKNSSTAGIGYTPHHEELRRVPHWLHPLFTKDENEFVLERPHGNSWENYIQEEPDNLSDNWFDDTTYGHAQLDCNIQMRARRIIPPATSEIFQDVQLKSGMGVI